MNEKGVKRKKKSFFQKSKKYYKKGIQGKGIRIDEESFEYFLHVLKVMNQEFESEDDKKIFVDNVFEQITGNEVNYSCNQVVSRIIDNLLPLASSIVLSKFMTAYSEDIRIICLDPFASFVLQKLISIVTERYLIHHKNSEDKNYDDENQYAEWLMKVFKFTLNNYEEFVFDNYANHVMRTSIRCLIGQTNNSTEKSMSTKEKIMPAEFTEILKKFTDQFLEWHRFKELAFYNLSSGFLQVLVECLSKTSRKRSKLITRKLLDECFYSEFILTDESNDKKNDIKEEKFDFSKILPSFENDSCIRLLEVVISVASTKHFTQIYAKCFINRLVQLSCHPTANFAVQKLIRYAQEKSEFESIFNELSVSFKPILEHGHSGVILQLCDRCLHHKTQQSVFMQLWMKYLDCNEPKDSQILVSPLTVFMKRKSEYEFCETNSVQLHGSLLIQNMLKFNKPIKVINSLLEIKGNTLINIFCDPKGSHIADAFFESEFVGEKSKEKLFKVLRGFYSSLAVSKHGSRVFDIIWKWANVKNRVVIASELLEDEAKLHNNSFGRPIIHNVSLGSFRHNKEEWIKAQISNNKAKKIFASIISES
ncbi:hypothetical protein PGB90_001071 [Kerria lacca]